MTYLDRKLEASAVAGTQAQLVNVDAPTRIVPRADFGKRFIVFVDTEEEFDWNAKFSRTSDSTTAISAVPEATRRFNDSGVAPVYLCDYPVVKHPSSGRIIQQVYQSGGCDIGAHLHPWVTPPHIEEVNAHNSYTGNLPPDLQSAKLRALTEAIEELIGERPTVFRAGRYGLGPQTLSHLGEFGYRMDVSVRSHFNYSEEDGPSFEGMPLWPWKSTHGVVELPLTSAWTGHLRKFPSLYAATGLRGALAKASLLSRVPLTPEGTPARDAIEAIRALHGDGLDIFSLSFHSPTLAKGFTPYVKTDADLAAFWAWWDAVFNTFAKLGVTPVRYGELIDELERP